MATASNNKLNRTGGEQSGPKTDSAKENYHAIKLSNPDASLTFSQIHKKADVTAAVMLQTLDAEHSFFMDKDGASCPEQFGMYLGKHYPTNLHARVMSSREKLKEKVA